METTTRALQSDAMLSEMEILSDKFLKGEIDQELYWKRWEEIKAEERRQQVRDNFESVLTGNFIPKVLLQNDAELDAKMDAIIGRLK